MSPENSPRKPSPAEMDPPRMVAVIDIGSTSIRMQISEIAADGAVRNLESFSQAVSLGRDSFVKNQIRQATIEDCVQVLGVYRGQLNTYGITDESQIRVVATSAVKEARNRLAFQDRIFIATGFAIEPFDEAELHRVTYLGAVPLFRNYPEVFRASAVICEVGGGTTELLALSRSDVDYSQTLRLGAIRLRTGLDALNVPFDRYLELIQEQVQRSIMRTSGDNFPVDVDAYIAMGSEIRFAAGEIARQTDPQQLVEVDVEQLNRFISQIHQLSPDAIATKYHFSIPDAESLGPALAVHQFLFREMRAKRFYVAQINLRDGMLQEMAHGRSWSESIHRQIVRSASLLGDRYSVDSRHAQLVAKLACTLFDELTAVHEMPKAMRGLLEVAALLHEVGLYVNVRSYHKHTAYLLRHSEFFGLGSAERNLVALIARYHRRAAPQPSHDLYSQLSREDRIMVSKLAAILRIAKSLDVSRRQKIQMIDVEMRGNQLLLTPRNFADVSSEQLELKQNAAFFESIFGTKVFLQPSSRNSTP